MFHAKAVGCMLDRPSEP